MTLQDWVEPDLPQVNALNAVFVFPVPPSQPESPSPPATHGQRQTLPSRSHDKRALFICQL